MKYFYEKPEVYSSSYGHIIELTHPIFRRGTLFSDNGIGIIVIQQRFGLAKCAYWDAIDTWLAEDIYLNKNFPLFFSQNATKDYPIIEIRKLMWALRMKPLKKEEWENYF